MKDKNHPIKEKTFVLIKPDGIQRTLIGEIIKRYERVGLKILALKMTVPTADQAKQHYTIDPDWIRKVGQKSIDGYNAKGLVSPHTDPIAFGEIILRKLVRYLVSGPVIAMVWEGAHSVAIVRKITGGTEPLTSDVGTIRGDFVLDSYQISDPDDRAIRNLVHASSSVEEANQEIDLWFSKEEIINYRLVQDEILYDVNLDGILE